MFTHSANQSHFFSSVPQMAVMEANAGKKCSGSVMHDVGWTAHE